MTDLFLIAHKVRGEPSFDVAIQMECPCCEAQGCHECDQLGYWWIIPTSGHRAYPYHSVDIEPLLSDVFDMSMPEGLPDHYRAIAEPKIDLVKALGLKPRKLPPIIRRL